MKKAVNSHVDYIVFFFIFDTFSKISCELFHFGGILCGTLR